MPLRILQGFRPAPPDFGAFAAFHGQFGIGAVVVIQIQQRAERSVGRDRYRLVFLQERVQLLHDRVPIRVRLEQFADPERFASGPEGAGLASLVQLVGNRGREEHPSLGPQTVDVVADRSAHRDRLHEGVVGWAFGDEGGAGDRTLRSHAESSTAPLADHPGVFQLRDPPFRPARGQLFVINAFGLQDEPAAPAHLRQRRVGPQHPDHRLKRVGAGCEGYLIRLVEPVLDGAAVGAAGDDLAVQQQDEPLVRAHVKPERLRLRRECPAEPQENRMVAVRLFRGGGVPNPRGRVDLLHRRDIGVVPVIPLGTENLPDLRRLHPYRAHTQRKPDQSLHRPSSFHAIPQRFPIIPHTIPPMEPEFKG